ncbi:beta-ketoacyl synthase chain length factor [Alteromonadaceae bacterium BrNp21-10]|nr:beta-ketoacyl synthase chain length factor [Alteromonadaceae bacterium BrNp21-10]
MKVSIASWAAWIEGVEYQSFGQRLNEDNPTASEYKIPVPHSAPAMQRRRLSKLAKITLSQIEHITDYAELQTVFCSRHGDLPKTSELVTDVANKEELSPTQFALSVHNAISGQFGIFSGNNQPSTLVSGGQDSFHLGLIDATLKLQHSNDDKLIFVYSDMPLPEAYAMYADEQQFAHCIVLELTKSTEYLSYNLTFDAHENTPNTSTNALPQSIAFFKHFLAQNRQFSIAGKQHWRWQKNGIH